VILVTVALSWSVTGVACAAAEDEEGTLIASIRRDLDGAETAKDQKSAATCARRSLAILRRRVGSSEARMLLYDPVRTTLQRLTHAKSGDQRRLLIRRGRAQLDSLEAARLFPPADASSHARASPTLKEVLSRREFQRSHRLERLLATVAEKFGRAMRWLLQRLNVDFDTGASVVRILWWGIGIAAVCLASFLVANALSGLTRNLRAEVHETTVEGKTTESGPRAARRKLLDAAAQHAAAGEFRQAVRCVYQATILALHLGGVIDYDANSTNREYAASVQAHGRTATANAFREATSLFEHKWYGCQATGQSDVDRMWQLMEAAEHAVGG